MPWMETLKAHRYGRSRRAPGDVYHAEDRDVVVLVEMGWAKKTRVEHVEVRQVREEAASEVPAAPRRRSYRRRDVATA